MTRRTQTMKSNVQLYEESWRTQNFMQPVFVLVVLRNDCCRNILNNEGRMRLSCSLFVPQERLAKAASSRHEQRLLPAAICRIGEMTRRRRLVADDLLSKSSHRLAEAAFRAGSVREALSPPHVSSVFQWNFQKFLIKVTCQVWTCFIE